MLQRITLQELTDNQKHRLSEYWILTEGYPKSGVEYADIKRDDCPDMVYRLPLLSQSQLMTAIDYFSTEKLWARLKGVL
jgi:hypothetical protein